MKLELTKEQLIEIADCVWDSAVDLAWEMSDSSKDSAYCDIGNIEFEIEYSIQYEIIHEPQTYWNPEEFTLKKLRVFIGDVNAYPIDDEDDIDIDPNSIGAVRLELDKLIDRYRI